MCITYDLLGLCLNISKYPSNIFLNFMVNTYLYIKILPYICASKIFNHEDKIFYYFICVNYIFSKCTRNLDAKIIRKSCNR